MKIVPEKCVMAVAVKMFQGTCAQLFLIFFYILYLADFKDSVLYLLCLLEIKIFRYASLVRSVFYMIPFLYY
jgi:hypothetical protein